MAAVLPDDFRTAPKTAEANWGRDCRKAKDDSWKAESGENKLVRQAIRAHLKASWHCWRQRSNCLSGRDEETGIDRKRCRPDFFTLESSLTRSQRSDASASDQRSVAPPLHVQTPQATVSLSGNSNIQKALFFIAVGKALPAVACCHVGRRSQRTRT